jgi:hypothetical protein
LNLAYHGARARGPSFNITLERDLAAGIKPIELMPQDITRVLLNLFGNGFHATRRRQRDVAAPGFEPTLKSSMAAASRWTARSGRSANSPSGCLPFLSRRRPAQALPHAAPAMTSRCSANSAFIQSMTARTQAARRRSRWTMIQ